MAVGQRRAIKQTEMGHACEWETSMILRLDPGLVGDYQQAPAVDMAASFAPAARMDHERPQ